MTNQSGKSGLAIERSARHSSVKRLRRLIRQSKARSSERAFVVEGPKLVAEAQRSDLMVEEVFVTHDPSVDPIVEQCVALGTVVHLLAPETLRGVLDVVNPQPVAAIVAAPSWTVGDVSASSSVLVGVELQDPGNAGTVLRSAEAAGCAAVVMCTPSVDWLNPKVVRASAGSVFRLPVLTMSFEDALAEFRAGNRRVVATSATAVDSYDQVDLTNSAILLGNEPRGLPDYALDVADEVISIPMDGDVESLNVAAAAAVLAFESQRQRRRHQLDSK